MNEVVFSLAAVRQFKLPPALAKSALAKSMIKARIAELLGKQDPMTENQNRFGLRQKSQHADFELRIEPWRVFYRRGRGSKLTTYEDRTGVSSMTA